MVPQGAQEVEDDLSLTSLATLTALLFTPNVIKLSICQRVALRQALGKIRGCN
jgi:hypothetical protein